MMKENNGAVCGISVPRRAGIGDHRDVPAFPAGICRVGGGLEDYQGTVVRLEEGLSGLEYRLESVNAMLAAIRASAGTAWHC